MKCPNPKCKNTALEQDHTFCFECGLKLNRRGSVSDGRRDKNSGGGNARQDDAICTEGTVAEWPMPYHQHLPLQERGRPPGARGPPGPPAHPLAPQGSPEQGKPGSKTEKQPVNELQKRREKQQEEMRAAIERAKRRLEDEELRRSMEQKAAATAKLKELELERVRRESAKEGDDAWAEELDFIEIDAFGKETVIDHPAPEGHHPARDIPPRFQQQQLRQQQLRHQLKQHQQQQLSRSPQYRDFPEGSLTVACHQPVDQACGRDSQIEAQRLQSEKQKTVLFEVRQRDWSRQQENLKEQLTYKEQQEISLQEQLRQKEGQKTELQEQLRQKERQETNLQERLRQKEEHETDLQEQLREKERQEANLQRQLRGKELEVHELEVALSATQQALDEQRRQEPRDWVISQDEIHATEKRLGTGGWGSVVEGTFRGCKVAVKQIHDLILSPYNRRLFEREMNMASRCRHPCLLQFIGATNDNGSPLLVTELMETSLRALLQERPLPQTELLTISLDVAQALNYLHLNRPSPIIHRDVSSANVLLWRQGDQWRGKVSDYGTANFMRQNMTTSPGAAIYSAPEAHTSRQTTKVDVYSFGVLLCEMCIREMPDPQRRDEQIALVPSRVLRSLTSRCVHLEPGTRPTMEDIIGEFEQYEVSS